MSVPQLKSHEQADIALILEGTYPYVRGGVSGWVDQMIKGLPNLSFALVFIGDKASNYSEVKYELPDNVVHLCHFYLTPEKIAIKPKARKGCPAAFTHVRDMHQHFRTASEENTSSSSIIGCMAAHLQQKKDLSHEDFLFSEQAWDFITESFEKHSTEPSFLDFFWTIRAMHEPLFALFRHFDDVPQARVFHSVSTGYAGLFGAFLHHIRQRPFILTEHGIYTRERKIDLANVTWIRDAEQVFGAKIGRDFSYLRGLWIRFFESIGRIAYDSASPILAITEGNRKQQIRDGAEESNVHVVPNGVDLKRFQSARESRPNTPPLIIGFIGRVVPIKDVKNFIRSIHTVSAHLPTIEAWIIGNEDEDPEYATECRDLMSSLNLQERVIYKGYCDVSQILAEVGLVVLSSISEGLPLTILEAFASGKPVVATDVGACRELIEGGQPDDQALGCAGAVVSIADSEALAMAIVSLLGDPETWRQACKSAVARVSQFYDEDSLFTSYQQIYLKALAH